MKAVVCIGEVGLTVGSCSKRLFDDEFDNVGTSCARASTVLASD